MPSYFIQTQTSVVLTSKGLVSATIHTGTVQGDVNTTGTTNNNNNNNNNNCCCPSSTTFLGTLTEKLKLMAESLKVQFAELKADTKGTLQAAKGAILSEIKVQGGIVARYEYIVYIQQYGPPIAGKFDPVYLERIRNDIKNGTIIVPTE